MLENDFFLVAAKDAFMEAARQFLFENYCRIHQVRCVWCAVCGCCPCLLLHQLLLRSSALAAARVVASKSGSTTRKSLASAAAPLCCAGRSRVCRMRQARAASCPAQMPSQSPHPSSLPPLLPQQAISIGSLSEKLNMDEEATEKWIVNLVR